MILKGSQRGNAKQLALHLLRTDENEHIEVHEVRGFMCDDVVGALKEVQATAAGTRCKQFLFSVSLSPPQSEVVSIDHFEAAIAQIEDRNGLKGQPRVIVFHEKEGRRHAHAVWSRIDAQTMTARNLSHFKTKLQGISRELYIKNDWKMPKGLIQQGAADPRNFTLAEWQQAKRIGLRANELKEMVQQCWAVSDSRAAFAQALSERGFVLARGDRRDFVVISCEGEVFGLRSLTGKRVKDMRIKLGDANELPSVTQASGQIAKDMKRAFQRHMREAKAYASPRIARFEARRQTMAETHQTERQRQSDGHRQRWATETATRAKRLRNGLAGIWQWVTGQRQRVSLANEAEALNALRRDRAERDALIADQLRERQALQAMIMAERRKYVDIILKLRTGRTRLDRVMEERALLETQSKEKLRQKRYDQTKEKLQSRRRASKPRPRRRGQRQTPDHDL